MSQHCAWMLDRAKDFQIQPNLEFPGAAQTCTGGVQPGFQNGAPTSSLSCSAAPWIQRSLCHDIVQISCCRFKNRSRVIRTGKHVPRKRSDRIVLQGQAGGRPAGLGSTCNSQEAASSQQAASRQQIPERRGTSRCG